MADGKNIKTALLLTSACVAFTIGSIAVVARSLPDMQIYAPNCKPAPSQKQRDDAAAAFAKVNKNDFDGAALLLDKCLDLSTWTDEAAVQAARTYTRAGQLQKAMQLLDQILKKDKSSPSKDRGAIALAWRYKGDCATDLDKPDDAVQDYVKSANMVDVPAIKMLSMRPAAHIRRKQKRYAEALDLLSKAAPKGTDDIYWHNEHAAVLTGMKKPTEALADLNFVVNEVKKRRRTNADQNAVLLREALSLRIDCYGQLKQSALAAADRNTLKEINQSWEEDLFGGTPIK